MTKLPVMDESQSIIKPVSAYLNVYTQQERFAYYPLGEDWVARPSLLVDELRIDAARGVYECTRSVVPKDKANG